MDCRMSYVRRIGPRTGCIVCSGNKIGLSVVHSCEDLSTSNFDGQLLERAEERDGLACAEVLISPEYETQIRAFDLFVRSDQNLTARDLTRS